MFIGLISSAVVVFVWGAHALAPTKRPRVDSVPTYDPVDRLKEWIPTRDQDWEKVREGEYYVSNNVWNKGGIGHYRQSIGLRQTSQGGIEAGWAWEWPDRNRALAFPELGFGKNPWEEASSTPKLPVRLRDLVALTVDFEFEHDGDGKRGTAFQIWLTRNPAATVAGIGQEIMIWLTNDGIAVKGFMAEVNLGGANYVLVDEPDIGKKLDWGFFAFHRETPIQKGKLDLVPFLGFLMGKGLVDKDEYLASIQLGNEVRSGVGITMVRRYAISVETAVAQ